MQRALVCSSNHISSPVVSGVFNTPGEHVLVCDICHAPEISGFVCFAWAGVVWCCNVFALYSATYALLLFARAGHLLCTSYTCTSPRLIHKRCSVVFSVLIGDTPIACQMHTRARPGTNQTSSGPTAQATRHARTILCPTGKPQSGQRGSTTQPTRFRRGTGIASLLTTGANRCP